MITRRRLAATACGVFGAVALGSGVLAQPAEDAGRQTYLFFVFSDPTPGQDAAYAAWFTDPRHAGKLAALPGVVSAQHLTPGPELRHAPIPTPHDLMLYTIDSAHPQDVAAAVEALRTRGDAWPDASVATVKTVTFKAFGPPVKGVGSEPATAKPGPMADYTVFAFHNVVDGQDQAFNSWYDTVHLPELLADPGVVSGQRAVRSSVQFGPDNTAPRYAMVMDIATSDLPAVFGGILHGGPPSPAIDRAHSYGFTYRVVQ